MTNPLVSVIIPAYNAAQTLPLAIASLEAQTWPDWEALIVDDASIDQTWHLLSSLTDPRIRCMRNENNLGRSLSRQRALDAARGAYVAFLDSDDWMFPDRLQQQVTALEANPQVVLVSAGMAVVDEHQRIIGVRGASPQTTIRTMRHLSASPVAFAASMFRRSLARGVYFNSRFPMSEDSDFVLRLILRRQYMILPSLAYVYCEHASASVAKMVASHRYMASIYLSYLQVDPLPALRLAVLSWLKSAIWAMAGTPARLRTLVARRSFQADAAQHEEYERAKEAVWAHLATARSPSINPVGPSD